MLFISDNLAEKYYKLEANFKVKLNLFNEVFMWVGELAKKTGGDIAFFIRFY